MTLLKALDHSPNVDFTFFVQAADLTDVTHNVNSRSKYSWPKTEQMIAARHNWR
jgi:hypothetical protein